MLNATPFLKAYAKIRLAQLDRQWPGKAQEEQLFKLLRAARTTKFGQDHGFAEIRSVAEYQKRVPLRTYEQMWQDYFKPAFPLLKDVTWPGTVPFFAVSSGTSLGTTKYLPVTQQMIRSNNKAGVDLLCHHTRNKPDTQIFSGKSFLLGGSTELVTLAPGVMSGDLSGIAASSLPWWARSRFFPPPELALLKNWEEKIDILSRRSLDEPIRMISGVPSWLLIFIERLSTLRPQARGKLNGFFPHLEMVVHGGVNFAPYHQQFRNLLAGSAVDLREVYPASEGFIATADRSFGEGLRMNLDHGLFFEFVPLAELKNVNPTRHWVGTVQPDINYAIILTTCAGLWSYVIGDTVKFVDTKTPRLFVTGRTSYYLSAFGEHIIPEEIEDAVSFAAAELQVHVVDYSVGALYPENPGQLGGHLFIIECAETKDSAAASVTPGTAKIDSAQLDTAAFSQAVDARLCQRNEDYEAHRAKGFGLNPPQIQLVKKGTFAAWMKSRGKLGGQNKVPRIITDRELFSALRAFVAGPF